MSKGSKDEDKKPVRRTIILSPEGWERVTKIREHLEATSDSEAIRRAVQLYDWLADKKLYERDPETGEMIALKYFW